MPNHPSLPIRLPSQLEDRGQASQYDSDVVQLFPVWRLSYLAASSSVARAIPHVASIDSRKARSLVTYPLSPPIAGSQIPEGRSRLSSSFIDSSSALASRMTRSDLPASTSCLEL
ncbi:hypothetical protein KCU89_g140, partial [Aureobasidium melanogenum]